jgi:chromate transporter
MNDDKDDKTWEGEPRPSLGRIFWVFLVLGATSLGGGVVGYLRTGLVVRNRWVDDVTFVELLSISQTLPGLNATNMSILVGDRLRGGWGALLATLGMCLPGAILMTGAAFAYGVGGDSPAAKAFLHGIAAGAVGLIVVVMVQLGSRVLKGVADYVFVLATAAAVAGFQVNVPYALIVAGIVAIWWHRPRDGKVHHERSHAPRFGERHHE